jgi:hypothetical protein
MVEIFPPQIYGPNLLPLDQQSRSLHDSKLQDFEISNPCYLYVEIFWNEISHDTSPFKCATKISSTNLAFGTFKSQIPASVDWIFFGVEDLLTCILSNQWL